MCMTSSRQYLGMINYLCMGGPLGEQEGGVDMEARGEGGGAEGGRGRREGPRGLWERSPFKGHLMGLITCMLET